MQRGNPFVITALLAASAASAGVANAQESATKGVATATTAGAMGSMQSAPNELAAIAYDRGATAFDAKDYPRAAEEFARADTLAPNTLTLQLALDSAMRAGRAALVMDLTSRAEQRLASQFSGAANGGDRTALTALVQRAHSEYEDRAGTLTIQCAQPHVCTARVDDRPWPINSRGWIGTGRHVLGMRIDGREERRDVVISPREPMEVRPDIAPIVAPVLPTPPSTAVREAPSGTQENHAKKMDEEPPSPSHSRRMSPTWFWVGATTTAVLGGLAIASGIDTVSKHDDFELNRTSDRASDGRGAQTRTNVLLGLTAIGAVTTATIAVFFVDWSHHRTPGRASTTRTTLGLGSCLTLTTTY